MSPKRKKSGEERKKQTSLQRAAWPGAKKQKRSTKGAKRALGIEDRPVNVLLPNNSNSGLQELIIRRI